MKFSKTILAFVMVAVLSLSMAFVAFAAAGTLEDPIAIESIDGSIAITVPAQGTVCYYADLDGATVPMYELSGKEIEVYDSNVTVKVYGINWDETLSEASLDSVNPRMYSGVVLEFANATDADIATEFAVVYPAGSLENPHFAMPAEDGTIAVEVPAWGATYYSVVPRIAADKMLDVSTVVNDVTSISVIIDGNETIYWTEDIVDGVITDAFDDVNAWMTGSVVIGVCGPMEDITGAIALAAKPGTYENPEYLVLDENGEAAVNAPAWGEKYYAVRPQVAAGKVLDVSGIVDQIGAVTVIVDGVSTTYWAEDIAEDGIIADAFDGVNMLTGSVMICIGGTMDPVDGTIALVAKAGTIENPNALVLNEEGEATVSVPAGETVYYWVVPAVAADKYLILGDLDLTVSVYVDGAITPYEVDENGNVMNAFEDVDKFFTNMVLVELTNTSEEDIEGTVALGIIEEEEEEDAPQTGVAAAILTVVAVLSGGYVISRRRSH